MKKKTIYKIEKEPCGFCYSNQDIKNLETFINNQSALGWELVTIRKANSEDRLVTNVTNLYIFKKTVVECSPEEAISAKGI